MLIEKNIESIFNKVDYFIADIMQREHLSEKNYLLEGKLSIFSNQDNVIQVLKKENDELKKLLFVSRKEYGNTEFVLAKALLLGAHPESRYYLIDVGIKDGIRENMAVVDEKGFLGRTIEVGDGFAKIILVNDINNYISVENKRNGFRGFLKGNGSEKNLSLSFVALNSEFKVGDVFTTSGLGGYYLKGIPIAEVVRIYKSSSSGFLTVELTPIANIDIIECVLVIKNQKNLNEGMKYVS